MVVNVLNKVKRRKVNVKWMRHAQPLTNLVVVGQLQEAVSDEELAHRHFILGSKLSSSLAVRSGLGGRQKLTGLPSVVVQFGEESLKLDASGYLVFEQICLVQEEDDWPVLDMLRVPECLEVHHGSSEVSHASPVIHHHVKGARKNEVIARLNVAQRMNGLEPIPVFFCTRRSSN